MLSEWKEIFFKKSFLYGYKYLCSYAIKGSYLDEKRNKQEQNPIQPVGLNFVPIFLFHFKKQFSIKKNYDLESYFWKFIVSTMPES